ncbi:hypothetical protein [Spongorhabdus nitratireducens]
MNLIEKIIEEASNDTEDSKHQSELMKEIFQKASSEEKKVINEMLVCIYVWSFDSLLEMVDE